MDHQPLRWPSRAISMSTLRTPGSSTLYMSSIAIRYADLVGALPVSMRDRVEGARLSSSATSSSLSECPSRRRRSSAPSLRLRTVGPRGTRTHLPHSLHRASQCWVDTNDWVRLTCVAAQGEHS